MKLKTVSPNKITNYIGKLHRNAAKKIAIGLVYSRGAASIAEQIGEPLEKGKEILDNVNKGFPGLKTWMDEVKADVLKKGYVDDCLGRRRHLPNALLPKFEYKSLTTNINPFLNCADDYVDPKLVEKYNKRLEGFISKKDFETILKEANKDGIKIIDNRSKIAECQREGPNWHCQSMVADIVKLNMISINKDPEMVSLGAELLLTIHDEVQMKVPKKNAEQAAKRLEYLMSNTCKDLLCIPLPSDATIEESAGWYMSEMETLINAHFNKYKEDGMIDEEAYKKVCKEESQLRPESIHAFLFEGKYLDY